MNYSQALDYLNGLRPLGVRPRLEAVRYLLELMGNPQDNLKPILVAGTNGKGSVSSMISSVLTSGGYKTGLYTSPHLISFTERIKIDGKEMNEGLVGKYVSELIPLVDEVSNELCAPTYFEVVTALCLKFFSDESVDYCVLEVGMGGRLDATNIIDPIVSVITSVGLDHTKFLGESIPEVAFEKAGIIHEKHPVVCAQVSEQALNVIRFRAKEASSPLHVVGDDVSFKLKENLPSKTVLDYVGLNFNLKDVVVSLSGEFQASNTATALCALDVLVSEGMKLDEDAIFNGLSQIKWPGRFEVIKGKPPVVLDGAHNPHAFKALSVSLKKVFPGKKIVLVLSVLEHKDVEGILGELESITDCVIPTQSSHPSAISVEDLASRLRKHNFKVHVQEKPLEALELAKKLAGDGNVVCACGSLYLVGDVKKILEAQ